MDLQLRQLEEKIDDLEEKLQKIFWFIEFHLGEVPQKYRKFNPNRGEYPYFKTKEKFGKGKNLPELNKVSKLEMPKTPEEYKEALARMKEYAKEKDKITEKYYALLEYSKALGDWKNESETISMIEAQKWVEEGPFEQIQTEFSGVIKMPLRQASERYRKVLPTQDSSAVSSTVSAPQDSTQENKHPEPSPSLQESPDHKNPPSQT